MCQVLLIEDDEPKLKQLLDFLSADFSLFEITVARSLNAAIKNIDETVFDAILLDMSLPTFDGGKTVVASGRQQTLGGRDVLRYLWELEIQTPVKVITGFREYPENVNVIVLDELHAELNREFPENYTGHILFTHSNDTWKSELARFMENINC
jgi:CheY-like chemotaxis protein